MEDKIFTKLQQKFFYIPLVIGWVLVVLACSLIFYITYEKTMTKVQSNLLKASDAPYFQSDNFLYIFDKNGSLTVSQLENAYTESEIEEITVFLKAETDNKFTIKSGKHFMYVKSSSVDDGITTVKYVIAYRTRLCRSVGNFSFLLLLLKKHDSSRKSVFYSATRAYRKRFARTENSPDYRTHQPRFDYKRP